MKTQPSSNIKITRIILVLIGVLLFMVFFKYNSWPYTAIKDAKSLIPYISEIRPYVEENWGTLNDVEKIFEAHPELVDVGGYGTHIVCRIEGHDKIALSEVTFLSEEEKGKISELLTEKFPFGAMGQGQLYTNREQGAADLRVWYVPEDELEDHMRWAYYMEELAPNWYGCTAISFRAGVFDLAPFQSQRKDGGLVRLQDRGADLSS